MFTDCFKITNVIPLHKKGNKNILDNFRPISLLPQFSKFMKNYFKKDFFVSLINIQF